MPAAKEDVVGKFVENKIVLLVARVATPMIMAFLVYVGQGWIDNIKDLTNRTIALEQRVSLTEATMTRGREDREEFHIATLAELRELRTAVAALATKVSALEATIQAMHDRAEAKPGGLVRQADGWGPPAAPHP